jgi:hypothetical protein
MVAEGSAVLIWTFYLVYISQNMEAFLWFITLLNLITAVLCMFATESPRYLYCKQQFEQLRSTLEKIAKFNGVLDYRCPEFEVGYDLLAIEPDHAQIETSIQNETEEGLNTRKVKEEAA